MKKKITFGIIIFVLFVLQNSLFAQSKNDSIENFKPPKPLSSGKSASGAIRNYEELQKYYIDIEKNEFSKSKYGSGIYLYKISHSVKPFTEEKVLFRLNYDNLFVFNTNNFAAGLNLSRNSTKSLNVYGSLGIGWGYKESSLFLKTPTGDKATINTLYFAQIELEKKFKLGKKSDRLGIFGGLGLTAVFPEKYDNNGLIEGNNGTILDPYAGARMYFNVDRKNLSGRGYQVYFHAKIGIPYTNGFTYENGDASPVYYGLGMGVTTLESKASIEERKKLMDIEPGIFTTVYSKVAYGQFSLPINILGNLSIGLNAQIGSGIDDAPNNSQRATYYWGFGADFRFYAYNPTQFFNPYLGVMRNFYGYNVDNTKYKGKLSYLRIGDKIRLGNESSNFFLDVNLSVPLNLENDWINYTQTTYAPNPSGTSDYIQSVDSLTMDIPARFDISIGLMYKFNSPSTVRGAKFRAKWDIYKEEELARLEKAIINDSDNEITESLEDMLPMEIIGDELTERRIYVMRDGCPPPPPYIIPNIDASDIKMLTLTYQARTNIDRMSHKLFKPDQQPEDSVVLLLAMFDKERTDTKLVNGSNMQLIFTDFNSGKFYGFDWDENQRLQPIDSVKRYVKELKWLDTDSIKLSPNHAIAGTQIENDVFNSFDNEANQTRTYPVNKNNYRFAYAIYPKKVFDEVLYSSNGNFGLSINFRYDFNKDFDSSDPILGHFKKVGNKFIIDPNDASFYSNTIVGRELLPVVPSEKGTTEYSKLENFHDCNQTVKIGNFFLGSDRLTPEQEVFIFQAAKLSLNCNISLVLGYTDKVEFVKNAEFMNNFLGYENNNINTISKKMKLEWAAIADEWIAEVSNNSTAIPSNELCQRGLAWKRIRTVIEEINKYNLVDMNSIDIKAEGIFKSDGADGNERDNPSDRKVIIQFSNR
jgi:hypothetical protein